VRLKELKRIRHNLAGEPFSRLAKSKLSKLLASEAFIYRLGSGKTVDNTGCRGGE
jgi:hypothetical protein